MPDKKKGASKRATSKSNKAKASEREFRFEHKKRKSQYEPKKAKYSESFYGMKKAPTGKGTKKKK